MKVANLRLKSVAGRKREASPLDLVQTGSGFYPTGIQISLKYLITRIVMKFKCFGGITVGM
jgi:hypothetical protein